MKKNNLKKVVGGVGLTAAAMMLAGNPAPAQANQSAKQSHEVRGITPERKSARHQIQNTIGGIPVETYYVNPGLSPKEYGLRYGTGRTRKGKTNFAQLKHQSKVKQRRSI